MLHLSSLVILYVPLNVNQLKIHLYNNICHTIIYVQHMKQNIRSCALSLSSYPTKTMATICKNTESFYQLLLYFLGCAIEYIYYCDQQDDMICKGGLYFQVGLIICSPICICFSVKCIILQVTPAARVRA